MNFTCRNGIALQYKNVYHYWSEHSSFNDIFGLLSYWVVASLCDWFFLSNNFNSTKNIALYICFLFLNINSDWFVVCLLELVLVLQIYSFAKYTILQLLEPKYIIKSLAKSEQIRGRGKMLWGSEHLRSMDHCSGKNVCGIVNCGEFVLWFYCCEHSGMLVILIINFATGLYRKIFLLA